MSVAFLLVASMAFAGSLKPRSRSCPLHKHVGGCCAPIRVRHSGIFFRIGSPGWSTPAIALAGTVGHLSPALVQLNEQLYQGGCRYAMALSENCCEYFVT
jgi:hypothetical protein